MPRTRVQGCQRAMGLALALAKPQPPRRKPGIRSVYSRFQQPKSARTPQEPPPTCAQSLQGVDLVQATVGKRRVCALPLGGAFATVTGVRGRMAFTLAGWMAGALALWGAAGPDWSAWTVIVANDSCPDYTWGYPESATRRQFAELVRAHLDEMMRTDGDPPEERDHYTMAVAMEALCFLEAYPGRRDEFVRRLREGRLLLSPFLCNTLWGFQSTEGAIRSLYPARRLERLLELPRLEYAHHIEHPALPWGVPTVLAGCGVRWLSVAFYDYDSTFSALQVPPVFWHEGPDGSRLRVVMDAFASRSASYTQGAHLLGQPAVLTNAWLPHYRGLGRAYPLRTVWASGTHGDTGPGSAGQVPGFTEAIRAYNRGPSPRPRLMQGTLAHFARAVEAAESQRRFLPTQRGCFGHSWDAWPVSLAAEVAAVRAEEQRFLEIESRLTMAALAVPQLAESTRSDRERAEWLWGMLADHAWNGSDDANRRENLRLRRAWVQEWSVLNARLDAAAWQGHGVVPSSNHVVVFRGPLQPYGGLVQLDGEVPALWLGGPGGGRPVQRSRDGERMGAVFVDSGIGLREHRFEAREAARRSPTRLRASPFALESPYYRLELDPVTGGIARLVHRESDRDLVVPGAGRTLGQTWYWEGREHTLNGVRSEVEDVGPVFARLRMTGQTPAFDWSQRITVYADLDRVDLEIGIRKPVTTGDQRLCHAFPVVSTGAVVRVEAMGAVVRPQPAPAGDLLPGADLRRFVAQGFVDVSLPKGPGLTIVPWDSFLVRLDLGVLAFEALGNDQNHAEVTRDQGGTTDFRFRYSLRAHAAPFGAAEAYGWSRSVRMPAAAVRGRLGAGPRWAELAVAGDGALGLCLKPADDPLAAGAVLRLQETAGRGGLRLRVGEGIGRVFRTDLLERPLGELAIRDGWVEVPVPAWGLAAVRIVP